MEGIQNLRGAVFSKYPSIRAFASAVGWSRNKASRILNGIQQPSICDIVQLTTILEIHSPALFTQIFFQPLASLWTSEKSD